MQGSREPIAHSLQHNGQPIEESFANRIGRAWVDHSSERKAELAKRHGVSIPSTHYTDVEFLKSRARKVATERIQRYERDLHLASLRLNPTELAQWKLRRAESDSSSWARLDGYYGRRLGTEGFYQANPNLSQGKFVIKPSKVVSPGCNGVATMVYNTYDNASIDLQHSHPNCQHYVDPAEV